MTQLLPSNRFVPALLLVVVALVAPFTMLMARLGVRIASRTSHDKLVKIFATLLVFVGLRMIYGAWFC